MTVVVTPRRFGRLPRFPFRFSLSFVLSFFGPSLETPFCSCVPQSLLWPLLTPQESLNSGVSPGQCLFFPFAPLGSTECRQWLLGFAFASAPDTLPHCPFVFLRSNVCYHPFAPAPCGDLAVRLRLAPQAPGENISSRQIRPLPGTLVWCNRIIFTAVALKLACGEARLVSIADQRSVTEEQRSHRPISAQPEGRQFFFAQTSFR